MTHPHETLLPPRCEAIDLSLPLEIASLTDFDRSLAVKIKDIPLLTKAPWVRTLGKLSMEVTTQGWRFPSFAEPVAGLKVFDPSPTPAFKVKGANEDGTLSTPT